jgi:hypothetical protein
LVSGVLIATGRYLGGAITGFLAVVLLALWRWGVEHDDNDRHTLW